MEFGKTVAGLTFFFYPDQIIWPLGLQKFTQTPHSLYPVSRAPGARGGAARRARGAGEALMTGGGAALAAATAQIDARAPAPSDHLCSQLVMRPDDKIWSPDSLGNWVGFLRPILGLR